MSRRVLLITAVLATLNACLVAPDAGSTQESTSSSSPKAQLELQTWTPIQPDLQVSRAPFRQVHANWKQRIDQPYVYVEYTGSYVETGRLLPMVHQAMLDQGLQPSGPPFGLYYDDPGLTPTAQLRSRACVPVDSAVTTSGNLAFDVLPSTTVVYAFAGGPYPDAPRAYPGLYGYMGQMGWVENGPIRETYLVPPGSVESFDDLLTEIQIPVTFSP